MAWTGQTTAAAGIREAEGFNLDLHDPKIAHLHLTNQRQTIVAEDNGRISAGTVPRSALEKRENSTNSTLQLAAIECASRNYPY